jgi:hypothetical protein
MTTKNRGQQYEESIRDLLRKRNLLPTRLENNDAGFIHNGVAYYVEVKNIKAPDFGQKGLVWSHASGWEWRQKDIVTNLYDELKVIGFISKDFIPRRYTVPQNLLTSEDRSYDQAQFEKSGIALGNVDCLYEYYARKQCFYIQIEGKGFYYLKQDAAGLGVPRFDATLTLRFRAKTHHSIPIHRYSFFAVIKPKMSEVASSKYDLEGKVGSFPPIRK